MAFLKVAPFLAQRVPVKLKGLLRDGCRWPFGQSGLGVRSRLAESGYYHDEPYCRQGEGLNHGLDSTFSTLSIQC